MRHPPYPRGGCSSDCSHFKKFLSYAKMKLLLVQFLSFAPCLLHVAPCEERGPILFVPPFKYCNTLTGSPWAFSFSREKKTWLFQPFLTQQILQSFDHLHDAPLDSLQSVCIFPELWGPEWGTVLQVQLHNAEYSLYTENSGMIMSLSLLVMPLGMQLTIRFTSAAAVYCWLILAGCPLRAPTFSARQLVSHTGINVYWALWLFCSRCRTWYLSLLKFMFLNSTAFSTSGWIRAGLKQVFLILKSTTGDKAKSYQSNLQDEECRAIFFSFRLSWCIQCDQVSK